MNLLSGTVCVTMILLYLFIENCDFKLEIYFDKSQEQYWVHKAFSYLVVFFDL